MKTLYVLVLVFYCQTATAACPMKDMLEFTYMTKKELINEYCSNVSDYRNSQTLVLAKYEQHRDVIKLAETAIGTEMADEILDTATDIGEQIDRLNNVANCSSANFQSAFKVLRKDYGIKEQDDIKCD